MISINRVHVKTASGSGMQIVSEIEEFLINFILPLVLVGLSVGIFALYISPTHKKIPELQAQVESKTQEVTILQAKVDQLTVLKRNESVLKDDLIKMSWALEERDKVPELTEQVRIMSEDSKVKFVSLDYANTNRSEVSTVVTPTESLTPDPELYKEEKVNVSISMDDIPTTVEFLKTTENSIRLFKTETLRITMSDAGNKGILIMASPYLNPVFSQYSETAAPINLTNPEYRSFMTRLDSYRNYAKEIDATLPKI